MRRCGLPMRWICRRSLRPAARLYTRLTLMVRDGAIEHVFYPIFPPNTHAQQVSSWLHEHP